MLDCVVNGTSVSNLDADTALVADFALTNFHNGDAKQIALIAEAPQCEVELANGVLHDPGPLKIYTPTTNLYVQGVGFYFVQSNHFLRLSNQVESRVLKSLVKSSGLAGLATNKPAVPGQMVKIFAHEGEFNFDSNVVDYAGEVHLIDPQLDMTCDYLTIRFATNGAVESMLARHNVVLTTTNNGRATGAVGFYYVTNGVEMMRLTTNAIWRNGDEEAHAFEFNYDSTHHFLTGTKVKVRWPNPGANSSAHGRSNAPPQVGANGFRELFADFASMQFPPTNGPVEEMDARGNVLIVNQADTNSAMAEQAVYVRATDTIELTGNPMWWSTNMEVKGDVLSAILGSKTYHAQNNARFKMHVGSNSAHPAPGGSHSTNQWLYISAVEINYQTNLAVFYQSVDARLVDNNRLRDTLTCTSLRLNLTNNQVESAVAWENVNGATTPDAGGVVKTISCQELDAFNDLKTGRLEHIVARTNVVIVEKGAGRGASTNTLQADTVTAKFSILTNQLQRANAEQHVVFNQFKDGQTTHATSEHGVYLGGANDEVTLTGEPLAHNDTYIITNADFLVWKRAANVIVASGRYQIIPINRPAAKSPPKL